LSESSGRDKVHIENVPEGFDIHLGALMFERDMKEDAAMRLQVGLGVARECRIGFLFVTSLTSITGLSKSVS
jgi:hypothetical protein